MTEINLSTLMTKKGAHFVRLAEVSEASLAKEVAAFAATEEGLVNFACWLREQAQSLALANGLIGDALQGLMTGRNLVVDQTDFNKFTESLGAAHAAEPCPIFEF
jgi:hypothetical protein